MLEGKIHFFENSRISFSESCLCKLVDASIGYLYVHRVSLAFLFAILNRPQVFHFLAISLSISLSQFWSLRDLTRTDMAFEVETIRI